MFEKFRKTKETEPIEARIERLNAALQDADAVILGAGAGLSAAAGYAYAGERFERYFKDFIEKYQIPDMYSGGFYPFASLEEYWAWWSRHIWINRHAPIPSDLYTELLEIVRDKDYFVLTTNVDHCFQRAGFDKQRLFYTQGDYSLFQSASGRIKKTWDNEAWVMLAMEAQGFVRDDDGIFQVPEDRKISMRIPHDLLPEIPEGGKAAMNLRSDDTFVEDAGWQEASASYAAFLKEHEGEHVLFLELGVGGNTPVIIKYPFWAMTAENPKAVYACLNRSEAVCPSVIEDRSICIDGDLGEVLERIL